MQGFGPTTYTLPSLFWLIVKKPRVSSVQHAILPCSCQLSSAIFIVYFGLTQCYDSPADDQLALLGLMG